MISNYVYRIDKHDPLKVNRLLISRWGGILESLLFVTCADAQAALRTCDELNEGHKEDRGLQ